MIYSAGFWLPAKTSRNCFKFKKEIKSKENEKKKSTSKILKYKK